MVSREDLVAVADATGLTPPVIEKDYILGWLLKGVYQHPTLRERRDLPQEVLFRDLSVLRRPRLYAA
jgi:hypothetical protein